MLLAGGQGSRLYTLTQKLAKPAVPFGGKYRIIDFPLSNCVNSGIDTVGILTQYQPLVLNEYIGNGQPWDLDRLHGGVHVLPPYQKATGSDWYKGTANAIYQNINFIERYDPEYVIILSGDQICKQDYSDFLRFHKEKNAEFSVAVMEVPWDEAGRFGLMVTDDNDKITEFQEKPKEPKSNLASMGIYIFNWDILKKYLIEDEKDPDSENDFGKNIIPNLLRDKRDMYAYRFAGYWKDVGTISSLWEANMEVLDPENSGINLFDEDWRIYSRNSGMTGHRIGEDAVLEDQAAAFMHHKRSILTVDVEELGLSEFRPGLLNPLHLPIVVHGVVVRLHHGALEKDDLINALDVIPVHRLLQPPAIVNQHDGQGAAEQPRPLDRLRCCGFPVQILQGVRYQRHNIVIAQIEVEIAGGRFLRRDVNDLGEQAVGLIVRSEINVRDRGLRHELICLAAVLFGSHAVQHIHVTVQAGKPALRLVLALIHSYHRLMLSVSSHQRCSSPQSRQSRWRRRPPCP